MTRYTSGLDASGWERATAPLPAVARPVALPVTHHPKPLANTLLTQEQPRSLPADDTIEPPIRLVLFDVSAGVFKPEMRELETSSRMRAEQWLERGFAQGLLNREDLAEEQKRLRVIMRAASKQRTPKPEERVNLTSGKQKKPLPKPVRDYWMPASVRRNGTVVSTRIVRS